MIQYNLTAKRITTVNLLLNFFGQHDHITCYHLNDDLGQRNPVVRAEFDHIEAAADRVNTSTFLIYGSIILDLYQTHVLD